MYKKSTLKNGKKSRKKTRLLNKKQTRKFRKYTRKNKNLVGGVSKIDLWLESFNAIPNELFLSFDILETDTADQILDKLKAAMNPGTLRAILERNRERVNGTGQQLLLPEKFSCTNVREIYKQLIKVFGSSWDELLDNKGQSNNYKAKALGSSWIRWVLRVGSRSFTDENIGYATRAAIAAANALGKDIDCTTKHLQERDINAYGTLRGEVMEGECVDPNQQCPSTAYLIKKYNITDLSDNSEQWNKITSSSRRSNAAVDRAAGISK